MPEPSGDATVLDRLPLLAEIIPVPFRFVLALLILCLLVPAVVAAPVIPPPGMFLFRLEHVVVAGVVESVPAEGALELRVTETLSGEPPEGRLVVHATPAWLAGVQKGAHVLVGFTVYQRSQFKPKALETRSDGAAIVSSSGLEPALFHDTPEARALIESAREGVATKMPPSIPLLFRGLQSQDLQIQNFCAAELALRVALQIELDDSRRGQIEKFVDDASAHPAARALLLRAAASAPGKFGDSWPETSALKILRSTPVGAIDAPPGFKPNLVYTAFEVLENAQARIPTDVAQRWVGSGHAALMEAALLSIRRVQPKLEREIAERVLESATLSATGREFLRDHLRRLSLMQAALANAQRQENTNTSH